MSKRLLVAGFWFAVASWQSAASAQAAPSPVDVAGRWIGGMDIRGPQGMVEHQSVFLVLNQAGSKLTGSAGQGESQQSTLSEGSVSQREVAFTVVVGPDKLVVFKLHQDGGHLTGEVTGFVADGGKHIVVDVVRLPEHEGSAEAVDPALYEEIARQDHDLFAAYNARDMKKMQTYFSKDLEFYHDKEGLTRYDTNMASFQRTLTGPNHMRRELVAGTMEVYPLGKDRAIETGMHCFYTTEPGKAERLTATARFVNVWEKKASGWEIVRSMSYDHR